MTLASVATSGTGTLDLTNNSMVVRGSTLSDVAGSLALGFNHGTWSGNGGITSSFAASDPSHLTTLGYASNATLARSSLKA